MASYTSEVSTTCKRCAQPLPPGALACEHCKTLVHAEEMERRAAAARALEAAGDLQKAHQQWMSILPLLPPDSKQTEWIRAHLRELESTASGAQGRPRQGAWAKRLAPLGPLAVVLAKAKTFFFALLKLKFLFSFAAFIGLYWAAWGPKFGIGFALLILIHELGHFVEIKRRGLPAEMPVFLPGLGAYVRWQALGVTQETRAAISLAGPMAGFLSAAVCAAVGLQTRDPIWLALARTGAWLNILNLIPIWVLDGTGAIAPLNWMEKFLVVLVSTGLGYATHEGVFYFVAGGTLFNVMAGSFAQRRAAQAGAVRLNINGSVQTVQTGSYGAQGQEIRTGSPLITAYFVAVLTLLGAVLYLLPGHGSGVP